MSSFSEEKLLDIGRDDVCPACTVNDSHFNIVIQKSSILRIIDSIKLQTRPYTIHNRTALLLAQEVPAYHTAKKEAVSRRT